MLEKTIRDDGCWFSHAARQSRRAGADAKVDEAERAIRQQIDTIQKKIDKSKTTVEAARVKGKEWAEAQKTAA